MLNLLPPERIERAARIYATAKEAASAMGISVAHFRRLCNRHDIPTPRLGQPDRLDDYRRLHLLLRRAYRAGVHQWLLSIKCQSIFCSLKRRWKYGLLNPSTWTPLARPTRHKRTTSKPRS
jgi:hypothetical protein